jgi:hypothetical protein
MKPEESGVVTREAQHFIATYIICAVERVRASFHENKRGAPTIQRRHVHLCGVLLGLLCRARTETTHNGSGSGGGRSHFHQAVRIRLQRQRVQRRLRRGLLARTAWSDVQQRQQRQQHLGWSLLRWLRLFNGGSCNWRRSSMVALRRVCWLWRVSAASKSAAHLHPRHQSPRPNDVRG